MADLTPAAMAEMMVGSTRDLPSVDSDPAQRRRRQPGRQAHGAPGDRGAARDNDDAACPLSPTSSLEVRAGEILGDRRRLRQRTARAGGGVDGPARARRPGECGSVASPTARARSEMRSSPRVHVCRRSRCATPASARSAWPITWRCATSTVAPLSAAWPCCERGAVRAQSKRLIAEYKVKTPGPDAPIRTLVRRERAAGGAGARAVRRCGGADRSQPGIRAGFRRGSRDPWRAFSPHAMPARRCCWLAATWTNCWRCPTASW